MASSFLFDDVYVGLPDNDAFYLEFKTKTTCMDLSFHGRILAVGFSNGLVEAMDSMTELGKKTVFKHKEAPVAVSFARDGKSIISADSTTVSVCAFPSCEVRFTLPFADKVISCSFSRVDPNVAYILTKNNKKSMNILNIATNNITQLDGCYTSFSLLDDDTIIASYKSQIMVVDPNTRLVKNMYETRVKKGIKSVVPSHKGNLVAILDKSGTASMLDMQTGVIVHKFQDIISKETLTTATFDRKDEYVIFGKTESSYSSFEAYKISDYSLEKDFQNEPRDNVLQVYFHPLHPIIFVRSTKCIHIWSPTYVTQFNHSYPLPGDLITNEKFQEPENAFDGGDNSLTPEEISCIGRPIDIFTRKPFNLFDSDEKFPDQVFYIPVSVEDIKKQKDEDEEEDEYEDEIIEGI